ncbi:MAG: sodium-dependent bicarbonate transport family permease [Shewanella sp.]|nr:sodium-dependent bicarbonate transport family permease [Shewanella sp.]MCF1431438.1 sodium-dependent bicarbonate transport family permease [Shewanella sp.]MCF1439022.1 sodium-dependent bicarbonate transport family permease [Shewanella sp.]MCF1457376.1 sodium-dependent bicarbonate transport family permease [Shewanella sp.]
MPDIVIAFFALGLLAGLVKSDLRVPQSIYETLSILLMLTLGLKGGMALHGQGSTLIISELALIAALGLIIPLSLYPLLRRLIRLSRENAVSIAAHYGSVSAGTFAVVIALAEHLGWPLRPETTLYLVLLELPAIIVMLWLYRFLNARKPLNESTSDTVKISSGNILHEALTSRGVILLTGGVAIGWAYGESGLASLTPVLMGGFKTLLALFLLEMGLCTARVCQPLPLRQWRLMLFAAGIPFILAWCGILLGLALDLPKGSILVLAGLAASASYIAAPAAIRAAIPDANIGLAMLASLGITFPINVLIGLPLYAQCIEMMF